MLDLLARLVDRRQARQRRHEASNPPKFELHVDELMRFRSYIGIRATINPALAKSDRAILVLPNGRSLRIPFRSSADHSRIDFEALIEPSQPVEESMLQLHTSNGRQEFRRIGINCTPIDGWRQMKARFMAHIAQRESSIAVLELGSRQRRDTVEPARQAAFSRFQDYSGFDIVAGENVDIVGDAHELSKYFPPNRFDVIYSNWVFEHLLMPWKAIIEINRILKLGGELFINTNQSIGLHDMPWDFWRYSDTCWHGLLNEATGFEIIEARLGEPVRLTPMLYDSVFREHEGGLGFQSSAVWARKTRETNLIWDVSAAELQSKLSRPYPNELKDPPPQSA